MLPASVLIATTTALATLIAAAPDRSGTVLRVHTPEQLRAALADAVPYTTVLLEPGTYSLAAPLSLTASDVTIHGVGTSPGEVQLVPSGSNQDRAAAVPHALVVRGARVVLSNVTARGFSGSALRFLPAAGAPRVQGVWFLDNGGAIHTEAGRPGVHGGLVEDSVFQLVAPRDDGTAGSVIGIASGDGWVLRRNLFRGVRAAAGAPRSVAVMVTGPANALIESNTFIDCQQEIVLGAAELLRPDHSAGQIRNNFISRAPWIDGGAAITVRNTPAARVLHNTALLSGSHRAVIELQSPGTTGAIVRNNLLDGPIALVGGAAGTVDSNNTDASPSMFVDAFEGDLHLTESATTAIDQAAPDPSIAFDWDGDRRPAGGAADIGADEFSAHAPAPEQGGVDASTSDDTTPATLDAASTTVTAATAEATSTSTFLPSPWMTRDIGSPAIPGSATYSSGTFTVKAAGADIWGTSDQFRLVYQPMTGDGQLVARVGSLRMTHAWAKAGVMMRASLNASSSHAFALVSAGGKVSFQQRTTGGGGSSTVSSGLGSAPVWLRLVRKGSQFTASRSADGSTWSVIGTTTVSMPSTIYVGLAVTSHNASTLTTASFTGVVVRTGSTSNSLPTVSLTSPVSGQTFAAPASFAIAASASDRDGSISKVEFYLGSTLVGSDATAPYSVSAKNLSSGIYRITAVAHDNKGARSTSPAVSITVSGGTSSNLIFTASPDHNSLVTGYVFEVFSAGADPARATPVRTQNLGKPAVVGGEIGVDVGTTIQSLASGTYFSTVRAVGTAGSTRSAPSNSFTR